MVPLALTVIVPWPGAVVAVMTGVFSKVSLTSTGMLTGTPACVLTLSLAMSTTGVTVMFSVALALPPALPSVTL